MSKLDAIILGIIQGSTEFLPISSSGHLVLFQHILGLKEPELFFDISVHIGTLIAVCIVFYNEIWSIISTLIRLPSLLKSSGSYSILYSENPDIRMVFLIFTGSIPTALLGFMFSTISDRLFSSIWLVGLMLIITGIVLWATRLVKYEGHGIERFSIWKSLVIGMVQGLAIIPGISRSGSTIAAGLFIGIERETAARFSFLLSIPAIIGAFGLEMSTSAANSTDYQGTIIIGLITSVIVGFFSLKVLLRVVKRKHFFYFAPYCWLTGTVILVWTLLS